MNAATPNVSFSVSFVSVLSALISYPLPVGIVDFSQEVRLARHREKISQHAAIGTMDIHDRFCD
jgi:hypothetical protein